MPNNNNNNNNRINIRQEFTHTTLRNKTTHSTRPPKSDEVETFCCTSCRGSQFAPIVFKTRVAAFVPKYFGGREGSSVGPYVIVAVAPNDERSFISFTALATSSGFAIREARRAAFDSEDSGDASSACSFPKSEPAKSSWIKPSALMSYCEGGRRGEDDEALRERERDREVGCVGRARRRKSGERCVVRRTRKHS